jgi:hypothetical protein
MIKRLLSSAGSFEGIVAGSGLQHRAGDSEQSVSDASKSAAVRAAPNSQGCIPGLASGVVLGCVPSPVVDRRPQPVRAGLSHLHTTAFSAPVGDRGDPGQSAVGVIIARPDGLMGLREQPDTGHGGPRERYAVGARPERDYIDIVGMICDHMEAGLPRSPRFAVA